MPWGTSLPLSISTSVTMPATWLVTSTPCEAMSVPIEASRSIHLSMRAGSAVTVTGGGFICDRKVRIICGLNTNWK